MISLAALLLAQAVPAAIPAAATDRAMLEAFRSACERVEDFEAVAADARATGWEPIEESGDPRVARLIGIGHAMLAEQGDRMRTASFRRRLAGRDIFLIASRAEGEGGLWGNGCRLYHFEAAEALAPQLLEAWMGRVPTDVQDLPGFGVKRLWEPGWRDGVAVEITYVRAGSEAAERFGISGNILVASAMGGF